MDQSVDRVIDWLNEHKGRLLIRKQELMVGRDEIIDTDEVELQFQKASIGKNEKKDPDDYVAIEALLLHGKGKVKGDGEDSELPFDAYEIPIEGSWRASENGKSVSIHTERAIYEISTI